MNSYAVTVGLACIRHTYVIKARDLQDAAYLTRIWDVVRIVRLGRPL
jgi:hypothetical protein